MLLGEFHGKIPLVEKYAAVNSLLWIPELGVRIDSLLAQTH